MIYLASPYTTDCQWTRDERAYLACKASAILFNMGQPVFSPIANSHYIERTGYFHATGEFWLPYDIKFMKICDVLYVLTLDGWEDSEGIKKEIDYAIESDMPIVYVKLDGDNVVKVEI